MTTLTFISANGLSMTAQYEKNPYYKNTIQFGGFRIVLQELPFDIRNTRVQIRIYEGVKNTIEIKHNDSIYFGWFNTPRTICGELIVKSFN